MRHSIRLALWSLAVSFLFTIPAGAAAPLDQVPAKSPLILHLKGIERTKDRVFAMIKNALPDLPVADQRKELEQKIKDMMEGREFKGMPKDGSILVAMTEWPEGGTKPAVALIVQVDDYKAFRDGVLDKEQRRDLKAEKGYEVTNAPNGDDLYFINPKGYAVITDSKALAGQYTKQIEGITKQLGDTTARKILESDVALYLDVQSINKAFGEQIKGIRDLVENMLDGQDLEDQGVDKETIKKIIGGFVQFIEDSKTLLVTGNFEPEGFALQTSIGVKGDSPTNAFLKNAKTDPFADLAKLPKDQLGYVAMAFNPELSRMVMPLLQGMPGKDNKNLKNSVEALIEADPLAMASTMSLPMQGINVYKYKDAKKAAESQLKILQAMKEGDQYQSMHLKKKPEVKVGVETHRDFKLNQVQFVWDFKKMFDKAPNGDDMVGPMKALMGEDMNVWFGTDGKINVQVIAKDWAAAKKLLDSYLDGKDQIGDDKAFQEARKKLPADATILSLTDLPSYVRAIGEFMMEIAKASGMPMNIKIPEVKKGTAYAGASVLLRSETIQVDLWVPGKAIDQVAKLVIPIIGHLKAAEMPGDQ